MPSVEFIEFVKGLENPREVGFDARRKRFFPHGSAEGGAETIGFGHKIQPGEDFSEGLSRRQAEALLVRDLVEAEGKVRRLLDRRFFEGTFDEMDEGDREKLVDFAFNGALDDFPKFVDAVVDGDVDAQVAEFRRFFRDEKGRARPLRVRNRKFFRRFLEPELAARRFRAEEARPQPPPEAASAPGSPAQASSGPFGVLSFLENPFGVRE